MPSTDWEFGHCMQCNVRDLSTRLVHNYFTRVRIIIHVSFTHIPSQFWWVYELKKKELLIVVVVANRRKERVVYPPLPLNPVSLLNLLTQSYYLIRQASSTSRVALIKAGFTCLFLKCYNFPSQTLTFVVRNWLKIHVIISEKPAVYSRNVLRWLTLYRSWQLAVNSV